LKEFPELVSCGENSKLLEIGCGNGSTVLPILRYNSFDLRRIILPILLFGVNLYVFYLCFCVVEARTLLCMLVIVAVTLLLGLKRTLITLFLRLITFILFVVTFRLLSFQIGWHVIVVETSLCLTTQVLVSL